MKPSLQTIAVAISYVVLGAGIAWAAGYSETSSYDPTPNSPNSGDECTITFSSSGNSAQNKTDVGSVKKAFDTAMAGSDDMQKKVQDACSKHGNNLTFNVQRDDPGTCIGNTSCNGSINVDVGDIENVGNNLSGKAADKAKVQAGFLTGVVAHETDHNRDSSSDNHGDPAKDSGTTGKPVDDENAVGKDLNSGVQRNNYAYQNADGDWCTDFTVDTQKVTFNASDFSTDRSTAKKYAAAVPYGVDPVTILDLPEIPCSFGGLPCYRDVRDGSPPLYFGDNDLDGVDDASPLGQLDNCLNLANPQQADSDFDNTGHGCDADDDNDGWEGELETAMGASDMFSPGQPEHWYYPGTCSDGIDNDRDRIIDNADQSCHAFPPEYTYFPAPTPVKDVFPLYQRRDLGSIPEGVDVYPTSMQLLVNVYASGLENWNLQGPVVVVRSAPKDGDLDGLREIDTQIVSMFLKGFSPSLGPLQIGVQEHPHSTGQAEDMDLAAVGDMPAESFFDIWLAVSSPAIPGWKNNIPDPYRAIVNLWPPYGTTFARPPAAPTILFDPFFMPVAEIIDGWFTVEIPDSDLDGRPDYEDNCPIALNPTQDDIDWDGVGDVCDLCPFRSNPEQGDLDGDGVGDACDPDIDGDGIQNPLDCAPFSPIAALLPQEVFQVMVSRVGFEISVSWGVWMPPRFRNAYDVITGNVGDLRASGGFDPTLLECLAGNAWSHFALDLRPMPAPGEALFYLVRERNMCEVGTFGDSGQVPDPRDQLDIPGNIPCPL